MRSVKLAVTLHSPVSGRYMDLSTNMPGLQFYSGNNLNGSVVGKGAYAYPVYGGMALETQVSLPSRSCTIPCTLPHTAYHTPYHIRDHCVCAVSLVTASHSRMDSHAWVHGSMPEEEYGPRRLGQDLQQQWEDQ